jgi:hypothetical protein
MIAAKTPETVPQEPLPTAILRMKKRVAEENGERLGKWNAEVILVRLC